MTSTTARATEGAAGRERLPRPYVAWLAGILGSLLGDAVLFFALGWAASAHGGPVAALVLTAVTVPRTLLLLLGGAVADRIGPRRVLLAGDAVMTCATLVLALTARTAGTPVWLLVAAGAVTGIVDAFYLPASGSMPRRIVGTAALRRALALRQTGGQLAALASAPLRTAHATGAAPRGAGGAAAGGAISGGRATAER